MKNDKASEIKCSHLLQILCLIFFFAVWLSDSFVFKMSTFLSSFVPLAIRIVISLGIIAIGSTLIAKAHRCLFIDKSTSLITTGIFAHVRHPMYLGIILTYLGYTVGTLSILTLFPWFIILFLYAKIANHEEKMLEERFGKTYLGYKKRVPKWIPKMKSEVQRNRY